MRFVRVHDFSRHPRDWSDIIRPGQYVVFPSRFEGGVPCDAAGTPTPHDAATCGIAESLAEAEAFCREQVTSHPDVRFDVFDAAGRSRPALLTVVHPTHVSALEGNAASRRWQRVSAGSLIAAAPVLFWMDWHFELLGLSTLAALNGLLFAGRLLQLDAAYAITERRRADRLAAERGRSDASSRERRKPV